RLSSCITDDFFHYFGGLALIAQVSRGGITQSKDRAPVYVAIQSAHSISSDCLVVASEADIGHALTAGALQFMVAVQIVGRLDLLKLDATFFQGALKI